MSEIGLAIGISNVVVALIGLLLALPLLRGKVKMNRLYGVRFRRSFESDELWYAINRYGARRLILWSLVLAAVGLASPFVVNEQRILVTIVLALAPAVLYGIGCLESYRYAQRL